MLQVGDLTTGYGKKQVLFGATLDVRAGEIVAMIGPNGAGKSTVLKAICGLIPVWNGKVTFEATHINGSSPAENVARGITFAPQGNRVFDELTVLENLEVGGFRLHRRELKPRIEEMLELFPALKQRTRQEAGKLSGGEQQMLALARALVPRPRLLLLDEPSLGLSPAMVRTVFEQIVEIRRKAGVTVLIVEQKVRQVLAVADRAYGLRLGRVALEGTPEQMQTGDNLKRLFLC